MSTPEALGGQNLHLRVRQWHDTLEPYHGLIVLGGGLILAVATGVWQAYSHFAKTAELELHRCRLDAGMSFMEAKFEQIDLRSDEVQPRLDVIGEARRASKAPAAAGQAGSSFASELRRERLRLSVVKVEEATTLLRRGGCERQSSPAAPAARAGASP